MSMQSENVNELFSALAKAQGQIEGASKDSLNPHFKSKYADLGEVWEACRQPLANNGLCVIQRLEFLEGLPALATILGHSSGQWIKGIVALPTQRPGAQEIGSCMTYMRRYGLASMVGVYQDDDDAESAQKGYRQPEAKKKVEAPKEEEKPVPLTEEQCAHLDILEAELNDSTLTQKMCDHFKIVSIYGLNSKQYNTAVQWFEKKIKVRDKGEKDESARKDEPSRVA